MENWCIKSKKRTFLEIESLEFSTDPKKNKELHEKRTQLFQDICLSKGFSYTDPKLIKDHDLFPGITIGSIDYGPMRTLEDLSLYAAPHYSSVRFVNLSLIERFEDLTKLFPMASKTSYQILISVWISGSHVFEVSDALSLKKMISFSKRKLVHDRTR